MTYVRFQPRSLYAAATLALALAGCAGSPPARFYTLMPAQHNADSVQGASRDSQPAPSVHAPAPSERMPTSAALAAPGGVAVIDVVPVSLAAQVDQPQLMLRDGQGAVVPQYSDRWSSPLPDEFRNALSDALTRRLGMFDVNQVKPSRDQPVWRVQVDVTRFDSVLDQSASLDATWRLRGIHIDSLSRVCRTQIQRLVDGKGVDSLVLAHQGNVDVLAQRIAAQIEGASADPVQGVVETCRTTHAGRD